MGKIGLTNKEKLETQKFRLKRCGSASWSDWLKHFDREFKKRVGEVKLINEKDREFIKNPKETREVLL